MDKIKDCAVLDGVKYEWLGQSTVRITGTDGYVIYTDPVQLDENPARASLILVTHHHVDHCLPEYIRAVSDGATRVAAYHDAYLKHCVHDLKGVRTIKIGQTVEFGPARVTGVEAYTPRGFHVKGEGCGFMIELSGQSIYFAGDTTKISEMSSLGGVDCAILPLCDNAYAIDPGDIADAVKNVIKPRLFIPVHYTPADEQEPVVKDIFFSTKDPRFFTRKEDPGKTIQVFKGTGTEAVILKKLGKDLKK